MNRRNILFALAGRPLVNNPQSVITINQRITIDRGISAKELGRMIDKARAEAMRRLLEAGHI